MPYTVEGYTINYDGGLTSNLMLRRNLTQLEKDLQGLNLNDGSGWHLDASMLTTLYSNGQDVTTWPDISTSAVDAVVPALGGWEPGHLITDYANNNSVVYFANDDGYKTPNPLEGQDNPLLNSPSGTMFFVARHQFREPTTVWGDQFSMYVHPVMGMGATNYMDSFLWRADAWVYERFGTTDSKDWLTTAAQRNRMESSLYVYEVVSEPGAYKILLNGTIVFSSSSNSVSFPNNIIYLGRNHNNQGDSRYFIGWIGEVLCYPVALSDYDRLLRRQALMNKWGIVP